MKDFEKLGAFYLGRACDPDAGRPGELQLYDSRHLLTHAVCVGMTGSGKTGLCVSVIEEAAIDGVPTLAIDPKGDLANLLLTFPDLAPSDFRPWIDEDEARRAGQTPEAFAAQQAQAWANGLAEWGQDGARIARLRAAAEFAVYTPGSRVGRPLSILSSLAAPAGAGREDAELIAERSSTTAMSVLTLAGVDAELRGREHTFLSALFADRWQAGEDLTLASLITAVQSPPFERIGVLDVESFYPSKDRFALATKLNAVLASPGFDQWLEGEPLDPGRLLYGETGRPRVAIVSIAHLDDERRMFVVSLLLNEIVGWMRRQSGTSSLRAIVYMDEIAGYFPPVAAPPSKAPLLTLLKQARAFGVGIVLATQNTVDLDYKGLGNAGTWFLGRLQTERDKARVLDGLEGAASGSIDRDEADRVLSALAKRVFLLHNVHAGAPRTFMTRWALSYLRGPLSREQLLSLKDTKESKDTKATHDAQEAKDGKAPLPQPASKEPSVAGSARPVLPPGIAQFFVGPQARVKPGSDQGQTPLAGHSSTQNLPPHYMPVALGIAKVTFADSKLKINETRDVVAIAPIVAGAVAVDWQTAEILDIGAADLETVPADGATFADLPKAAAAPKSYVAWQKGFSTWLAGSQTLDLWRHAPLKLTSAAGESERDFRIRVQGAQHEARDAAVDAMRRKFADKRARVEERVRRAEQNVQRESEQASQAKLQTAVSLGATIFGTLLGRKTLSTGNLGRATTAMRGAGRAYKEGEDVSRAQQNVAAAKQDLEDLDAQIAEEIAAITARYAADADVLETLSLSPKRGQILVQTFALGWRG